MSQHRIVILKDVDSDRFLPIWIGPYEAEAITVSLQQLEVSASVDARFAPQCLAGTRRRN